jgi:hypothetical protein
MPQMSDPINGKRWPLLVVFLACGCAAVWYWGINTRAISYGTPDKTYFSPDVASPGQKVRLNFDGIIWFHLCPSELVYTATCEQDDPRHPGQIMNKRIDFPIYPIAMPNKVGPVESKWREFTVPDSCRSGLLTYRAFARSYCLPWPLDKHPVYAEPPVITLTVK